MFSENGLLSFENPNYHLDPARLEDARNRNNDNRSSSPWYEKLYREHFGTVGLVDAEDQHNRQYIGCDWGSQIATTHNHNSLNRVYVNQLSPEINRKTSHEVASNTTMTKVQGRRTYATLDIESMGVDVTQGPLTNDLVKDANPLIEDNSDNRKR